MSRVPRDGKCNACNRTGDDIENCPLPINDAEFAKLAGQWKRQIMPGLEAAHTTKGNDTDITYRLDGEYLGRIYLDGDRWRWFGNWRAEDNLGFEDSLESAFAALWAARPD